MRPTSIPRFAIAAFVGVLVIAAGLILVTDLRVEHLGTVVVFDTAFVCVLLLLYAPGQSDH